MKHGLIGWIRCFLWGHNYIGIKEDKHTDIPGFQCYTTKTQVEVGFCVNCGEPKPNWRS